MFKFLSVICLSFVIFGVLGQDCVQEPWDLVYVVDASGSITATNFAKVKDAIKDAVKDLNVGPGDMQTHVGMVTFDTSAHFQFDLATYTDKPALLAAIDAVTYTAGGTNIYSGMDMALTQVFGQNGDRSFNPDIMVVVTDGQDNSSVGTAQQLAESRGITVWAVGVGPDVRYDQLVEIAGSSQRVRNTTSFDFLKETLGNLPCPKPTPCTKVCDSDSNSCSRTKCVDKYAYCAGWAKLGLCTSSIDNAQKMEKDCPASCGYCTETCDDLDCSQECTRRALLGECLSKPEYMLVRCKKTCSYCDRCTNLHTACPFNAAGCTDNAQIPQMYFYCRATCNLCTPTSNCSILDPISKKCPRDWVYSNQTDKCYWATPNIAVRNTIQARCVAEGGTLASVHSIDENNYFSTYLPTPPGYTPFYFHGLYRAGGLFNNWQNNALWQDGSVVNYVNWASGQPSGGGTELNAGLLLPSGVWHDFNTADTYPGFCQKAVCPAPTTTTASTTTTTTTAP